MDIKYCGDCTMRITMYDGDWNWCNDQRKDIPNVKKCNKVVDEKDQDKRSHNGL